MDALNFLFQKPTLTWFDFYLEPHKLKEHTEKFNPDPSSEVLIAQFCEQAKYEESFVAQTDLPADEIEYHKTKCKKLWILALKVCAYCNWNISFLRKNVSLVHLKRIVEELCATTWDTNTLSYVLTSTQNLNEISSCLRFAAIFTARWVLDSYVHNNFPQPPPKITVSNPSVQIDPSQAFLEAKVFCLDTLKLISDDAKKMLEIALELPLYDYCTLSPDCFEIPTEGSGDVYLNWSKVDIKSLDIAKLQIKYDLGVYYFFAKNYEGAKICFTDCSKCLETLKFEVTDVIGPHWTFDEQVLNGYCTALGLPINVSAINPSAAALKFPISEQTAAHLLDMNKKNCPSLVVRSIIEDTAALQNAPMVHSQILSANLLKQMQTLFGINENWLNFFNKLENVAMFCLALKKYLGILTNEIDRKIVRVYLKFLCACLPHLRESLTGCGIQGDILPLQTENKNVSMEVDVAPTLSFLQNLDGMWLILNTFEPTELKQVVSRVQPRTSSHYFVQSSIQSCMNRLPHGPIQDLIVLGACKAQQLANLGNIAGVTPLIEMIVQEYRSCLNEMPPPELIQENVRLELTRWHDLAHRCSNFTRIGVFTQDLASKIKNIVVEAKKPNSPAPSWEMSLLISAFLLNTCDWDYIIKQCQHFRNRFMDFAKVLAVLCNEVSKGGNSFAREFFDIMLPTMLESGSRSQLLSRSQFILIVKLIKEQTAISVLLSFFGKLFNCKQSGLTEIFNANVSLWPSTYADANNVSEPYLKEVLAIILDNGLIVNPNNAFWLRTMGDLRLVGDDYNSAIQYYLQCLSVTSDYFTKPLPENVVDDKMIANLIRCCGRLECHTAEALFSQFVDQPNYNAAIKALQETTNYDGVDAYFPFIWDVTLLEFLISNAGFHDKSNQQGRLEEAVRVLNQQEINMHNSPTVLHSVEKKRKADFLSALCNIFL